jgi:acylphosphatase
MPECIRFVVNGRVQGVGYRAATVAVARRLGLAGWVRNTASGAVEVLVSGEPGAIATLAAWLWKGPDLACVVDVQRVAWAGLEALDGLFSIRRDA